MSFVYATSFANYNAMSATTAATGFAATNAGDRNLPFLPWRSTTTGSDQDLIFDCGSTKTLVGICLYDVNVASLKIALSTDAITYATAIPGYTVNTLFAPALDGEDGRYKFYITFASQSVRALKITIPSGTARTDGASYFRVGTIFWMQAIATLTKGPAPGMQVTWSANETQQELSNGRLETLCNGETFITFAVQQTLSAANAVQWNAVKTASVNGTPFLWMFNKAGSSQDVYWAIRAGEVRITKQKGQGGIIDEHQINWRQRV